MLLNSTSTWTRAADACAKNTSKIRAPLSDDETTQRDVNVAIHAAQQPFRYFLKSVNSPPYIRFAIPGTRKPLRTCKSKVSRWIYIALYYKPFISKVLRYGSCVTMRNRRVYLLPAHEPYLRLSLLPSRKATPHSGWYSLRLTTKGWPGWVDLGGWSHTR